MEKEKEHAETKPRSGEFIDKVNRFRLWKQAVFSYEVV